MIRFVGKDIYGCNVVNGSKSMLHVKLFYISQYTFNFTHIVSENIFNTSKTKWDHNFERLIFFKKSFLQCYEFSLLSSYG